jgi:2-dehydro-3-deoxyphosphooctonate aldolase (KDO 8-P synthase)
MSASDKMILIAGPCVIENEDLALEVAESLKAQLKGLPVQLFFKSSFDKANRTSVEGFRGPGLEAGLKVLEKVKKITGLPVLTDVHTPDQVDAVASVCDFIQIPAFLCRQTDLVVAGAEAAIKYNRKLNIKKGQFLAPWDTGNIVDKVRSVEAKSSKKNSDPEWYYLTERGTSFGYNTLVVDMISFDEMKRFGVPTIFDATHSVQKPGGGAGGKSTGGNRHHIEVLARAAMSAGADGLFMECHPRPAEAKSDGPNAFYLDRVGTFIQTLLEFRALTRKHARLIGKEG